MPFPQKPLYKTSLSAVIAVLIAQPAVLHAQQDAAQEEPIVIDGGSFGSGALDNLLDDFFDDVGSGSAALFDTANLSPRLFRFQLSHQFTRHMNRKAVTAPDGTQLLRKPRPEVNRLGLNVRYQNPFASGWLLQGSGQIRAWLPGDYEYSVPGQYGNPERDDAEWRINELFIQRSGDRHSVSLGRQTIVWGETTGNSVLDVINTTEYRDLSIIDIEDARLNQWLLVWDMFGENNNWSSFVNLYPEFNPVPVTGSPLYPAAPQINGQPLRLGYHHREKPLFEAGTRWSRSFTGSDIAVMAAWLYENPLRYTLPLTGAGPDGFYRADSNINDYGLLGLSANRAIGRLLLTLDVAYSKGVMSDNINTIDLPGGGFLPVPEFEKRNRLGASLGMEYGISPTQQISLSVSAQQDHNTDLNTRGNVLMRYSNSLRNDELVLSATMQSQLDGDAWLMFLGADYRVTDNWEISGQLVLTYADASTPLFFLDQDVRAGITMTWSF